MKPARITLVGGPWNGRRISDTGTAVIRMGIATRWHRTPGGWRPSPGARTGTASYEPSPDRRRAFYLTTEWDGVVIQTIG